MIILSRMGGRGILYVRDMSILSKFPYSWCSRPISEPIDVTREIPEGAKILLPACAVVVHTFESF